MKKRLLAAVLGISLVSMSIIGCGKTEEVVEAEPEVVEEAEPEEVLATIGTESEDAYSMELTNTIGQDITGVAIKSSADEEYPENMLEAEDVFAENEARILYYAPKENAVATETESGKEDPVEFTVQLTLADESQVELHAFPLEIMTEGTICMEDGIAYLVYHTADSEAEVNTLEAEQAVKALEEEQRAAEEAAAAAAAEAAAQEAQTSAQPAAQPANNGGSTAATPAPAAPATPAPTPAPEPAPSGGGDDGCLDDGLVW